MNKKIGILFLLPVKSIQNTAILQSQVLEPARLLVKEGFQVHILNYEQEEHNNLSYYQKISSEGISLSLNHTGNLFMRLISMSRQVSRICKMEKIDILYFRDIWGGLLAKFGFPGKVKKIYDLRAVIAEESAYRHNRKFPYYYLLKKIEALLIKSADRISVVSNNLKEYVLSIKPESSIQVLPSAVNPKKVYYSPKYRAEIRTRYAIKPEDIVFTYIGSISKWQQFDFVVRLFRDISASLASAKFLVITPDRKKILDKFENLHQQSGSIIVLDKVPHEEIYQYLSAADIGFLIREQHLLNFVSSPLKFAEYLICGVPVITTPWVGDYSEHVEKYSLGVVIQPDDPRNVDRISQLIRDYQVDQDRYKSRCIEFAEGHLSWNSLSSELEALYQFD
ncbi:MAG: glycosyltransferase family 4 protein [Anaerolineales bacterium]